MKGMKTLDFFKSAGYSDEEINVYWLKAILKVRKIQCMCGEGGVRLRHCIFIADKKGLKHSKIRKDFLDWSHLEEFAGPSRVAGFVGLISE